MSYQNAATPITVAILGGDSLVGQALKLVLQGADYDVRFLNGAPLDKPAELLDGVQLVLLTPRLSAKRREMFLSGMRSTPATAGVPVLELVTVLDETRAGQGRRVPWPCRVEELEREIEAALLSDFEGLDTEQAGGGH